MKKVLSSLGTGASIIIGVPIILVVCIGLLLFIPFDILRYHRMPYYKDIKKKYRLLITSSGIVQLYNRIVLEKLPIEYINYNDYEYFIQNGQVFLCGWSNENYKQIDDEWFFILDNECNTTKITMEEAISDEKELLKLDHKCLPAKFLIFYSDITDAEKFEQAKECPYFHCVFSAEEVT